MASQCWKAPVRGYVMLQTKKQDSHFNCIQMTTRTERHQIDRIGKAFAESRRVQADEDGLEQGN